LRRLDVDFFRLELRFFPPPSRALTVAQALRAATRLETPRDSYDSSMCLALRFCLSV
jgi:hypothetical protein